jgi:FkbM family methyltransferase
MNKHTVIKNDKWVWPASDENSWILQNQYNDLANIIKPHLKNNKCMVQAGGNCGFLLNTFIPHFEVIYTFEPDPINFYCLVNNVSDPKVIKMQCCLGNEASLVNTTQLIRPDRPNDIGGVHINGSGYIPTILIDNLNLSECDLIQLDIEGYELNALIGATKTIQKYKPVLCIEFCEKWLNRYNADCEKLNNLIESFGYEEVANYGVDKIFTNKK